MCIYVAFHRCAAATFGHVRLSTLPQVILARLELLVSTHFNGGRFALNRGNVYMLRNTVLPLAHLRFVNVARCSLYCLHLPILTVDVLLKNNFQLKSTIFCDKPLNLEKNK